MITHNHDLVKKIKDIELYIKQSSPNDWLRTQEAAIYLGISITQIHNLKREGIIPFTKLGGSIYFKRKDIDDVLEANKIGGASE